MSDLIKKIGRKLVQVPSKKFLEWYDLNSCMRLRAQNFQIALRWALIFGSHKVR
jgi:hypothetical protein